MDTQLRNFPENALAMVETTTTMEDLDALIRTECPGRRFDLAQVSRTPDRLPWIGISPAATNEVEAIDTVRLVLAALLKLCDDGVIWRLRIIKGYDLLRQAGDARDSRWRPSAVRLPWNA